MAKEKDQNMYRPIKNPELLNGKKDTQQERLDRGSQGNSSGKDWKGFLHKQKERNASEKTNLDAKVEQRKQQLEKEDSAKQNKEQLKNKEHDKDR
jgi:hypothetical protein